MEDALRTPRTKLCAPLARTISPGIMDALATAPVLRSRMVESAPPAVATPPVVYVDDPAQATQPSAFWKLPRSKSSRSSVRLGMRSEASARQWSFLKPNDL